MIAAVPPERGALDVNKGLPHTRRFPVLLALVAALAAAAGLSVAPALAGGGCADQVVADWYDNGRVDKLYELHCYREAVQKLPVDVRDYSSAKDDILRALAFAQRGTSDPGGTGTTAPETTPETTPTPATTEAPETGAATTAAPKPQPKPKPIGTLPETGSGVEAVGNVTEAAGGIDTSGPSSVPVPLLVLGGLALLLLAAGSASYLARRHQARRGGPGAPA